MGSISSKTATKVGNFQAGVGTASADINLVGAYIFGGIMFVLAIVFAVIALVPSSDSEFSTNIPCSEKSGLPGPFKSCPNGETCDPNEGKCKKPETPKKRHLMFLIGTVIAILVGIAIIWLSRVTSRAVHSNRAFAETYGTLAEANLISNAFRGH